MTKPASIKHRKTNAVRRVTATQNFVPRAKTAPPVFTSPPAEVPALPQVPESPLGLTFTPIPYQQLMDEVLAHHNEFRTSRKRRSYGYMSANSFLKHQRQAVRQLKAKLSNYNTIMGSISQRHSGDEREAARNLVNMEAVRVLSIMYPKLKAAVQAEFGSKPS